MVPTFFVSRFQGLPHQNKRTAANECELLNSRRYLIRPNKVSIGTKSNRLYWFISTENGNCRAQERTGVVKMVLTLCSDVFITEACEALQQHQSSNSATNWTQCFCLSRSLFQCSVGLHNVMFHWHSSLFGQVHLCSLALHYTSD